MRKRIKVGHLLRRGGSGLVTFEPRPPTRQEAAVGRSEEGGAQQVHRLGTLWAGEGVETRPRDRLQPFHPGIF